MTDSTPPSIPPRTRPTAPASTGRQTTSSPVRPGTKDAWNDGDEPSTQGPTQNGGSNGSAKAAVLPPTVAPPPRKSTTAGRGANGAPPPTRRCDGLDRVDRVNRFGSAPPVAVVPLPRQAPRRRRSVSVTGSPSHRSRNPIRRHPAARIPRKTSRPR